MEERFYLIWEAAYKQVPGEDCVFYSVLHTAPPSIVPASPGGLWAAGCECRVSAFLKKVVIPQFLPASPFLEKCLPP